MNYLGNFAEDTIVDFMWSTNNASGASITRSTNGTISVYKGNSTTQSTAGVTDTEDFDSLTGIHHCRIDTSADAFYEVGKDYMVVLSAGVVDGQSINAVLAHFSIQNRYQDKANFQLADGAITAAKIAADAITAAKMASDVTTELQSGLATSSALATVAGYLDTEIAAILAAVDTEIAAIKAKTDLIPASPAAVGSAMTLAADAITAAVLAASAIAEIQAGLSTLTPADVNTEMVDVLTNDTHAEPSGVPAATSSIVDKLNWVFMLARNTRVTSATQDKVRNDANSADVGTAALSDDGTAFTRGEYA